MLLRTIAVASLLIGVLSYVLWGFALWAAALLFVLLLELEFELVLLLLEDCDVAGPLPPL